MGTITDTMRQRLLHRAGVFDTKPINIKRLRHTQWSKEFESLMRNRLVMGGIRYGEFGAKGKPQYDSTNSAIERIKLYQKTGNTEHLVDAANLCLVEFVEGKHPKKHFKAVDDGVHAKVKL